MRVKGTRNTVKTFVRKACATTLAIVILPHPWTTSAMAEQNNWVQGAAQAIQQTTGAIQGAMMQAQMMTPIDLSPSMMRNVPAANMPMPFNKCVIPQSEIPMPRYCEAPGNGAEFTSVPDLNMSPTYRSFLQTKEFARKMAEVDLARMLDPAKNEFSNGALTGVKCLETSLKNEKSRMQGILNSIQKKIAEIKARNEQFKEAAKLIEMDMNNVKAELFGVKGGDSHISSKLNPPIKLLPAACQNIIENAVSSANSAGLVSMRDEALKPAAREGGEFLANEAIYRNDIQRFISQSQNHINQYGIDSFLSTGLNEFKGNAELRDRLEASLSPYVQRVKGREQKIRAELEGVGYNAPAMDQHFQEDFDTFRADATNYFRKQFVHDCVTKAESGVGLNVSEVINALRQESTNNQGTTIIEYRAALEVILKSDSFIEDKLARIKALDQQYGAGNITLSYVEGGNRHQRKTPYDYFAQTVQSCENRYAQDDTFSTSDQGRSAATKIARASEYLNELKGIHDGFHADLTAEITNEVLNCNGRATEAGSCSLQSGAFAISAPNFCFKNANACATKVNSCFREADKLVVKKNQELNTHADKYNTLVQGLFTDQKRYFTEFQAIVEAEAGLLNGLIPGADFVIPKDMFVSMPELALDSQTGVYLRGENSETLGLSLDKMTTKMEQLKSSMENQGKLAQQELQKYIKDQEGSMRELQGKFEKVAKQCDERLSEAEGIVANFNSERQQAEQKARSTAGEFCGRFYDLSTNPAAGCDDIEDLYSKSAEAVAFIDESARKYVNNYKNLCRATQNEREAGSEEGALSDEKSVIADVTLACLEDNRAWKDIAEEYQDDFVDTFGDAKEDVQNFLKDYNALAGKQPLPTEQKDIDARKAELDKLFADFTNDKDLFPDSRSKRPLRNMLEALDAKAPAPSDIEGEIKAIYGRLKIPTDNAGLEDCKKAFPNNNRCDSVFGGLANTKSLEDKIKDAEQLLKETAPTEEPAKSAYNKLKNILGNSSDYSSDAQKKAVAQQKAIDALKKVKTADACDQVKLKAYAAASSECRDSSESKCFDDKINAMIDEGTLREGPVRSIASLGLSGKGEKAIQEAFGSLGETRNFHCDALAQNKRGSAMSELEAFDRSVLGDDMFDDLHGIHR